MDLCDPSCNVTNEIFIQRVRNLLISWSLDPNLIPEDPTDIKAALEGKGLEFDPEIQAVHIHRITKTEMHLMLPKACQFRKRLNNIE